MHRQPAVTRQQCVGAVEVVGRTRGCTGQVGRRPLPRGAAARQRRAPACSLALLLAAEADLGGLAVREGPQWYGSEVVGTGRRTPCSFSWQLYSVCILPLTV